MKLSEGDLRAIANHRVLKRYMKVYTLWFIGLGISLLLMALGPCPIGCALGIMGSIAMLGIMGIVMLRQQRETKKLAAILLKDVLIEASKIEGLQK